MDSEQIASAITGGAVGIILGLGLTNYYLSRIAHALRSGDKPIPVEDTNAEPEADGAKP